MILYSLSEILLLSNKVNINQNNYNISYFYENKIIEKLIILIKYNSKEINIKIMKNLIILISNSANIDLNNKPNNNAFNFFYYACSNEYLNQIIINLNDNFEEQDDDYLSYYINFLKAISNKMNYNSLKLIYHYEYNIFPLLDQIFILLNHDDIMIRNSARNIFLSLIKINYAPLIEYLCDIPRISIFIILIQKIKATTLLLLNLKNNNTIFYHEKSKELKEKMIEDLLFIQDILSINIDKINYILINCLFSIEFVFLFGKIISFPKNLKSEITRSIDILKIILQNIKNQIIKNIICYLINSDYVYSKINIFLINIDIIENKNDKLENIRLLNLNNLIFNYNYSKLEFEDFIILNYSKSFLKSIKYNNKYKIYNEINGIYNCLINKNNENNSENEDIKICIQMLNEKYIKNKDNFLIRMLNYHYYISKITGINCGIYINEELQSFCILLFNNFLLTQLDIIIINNNINNYYESNILKKAFLRYLNNEILNNNNNINTILNIILLLIQVINDKDISQKLMQIMNIRNEKEKIIIGKENENNIPELN